MASTEQQESDLKQEVASARPITARVVDFNVIADLDKENITLLMKDHQSNAIYTLMFWILLAVRMHVKLGRWSDHNVGKMVSFFDSQTTNLASLQKLSSLSHRFVSPMGM